MVESDKPHRVRELLDRARECEPAQRLADRTAALDRADTLLAARPDLLDFRLQVTAERAIDAARANQLAAAQELADRVLDTPAVEDLAPIAAARALEARARAWAWSGTDRAAARADRLFTEVADRHAQLGDTERQGFVTFWQGYCVQSNFGDWRRAHELMRQALMLLAPLSPWRATILSFFADLLITMGQFAEAEQAIAEGIALADASDDAKTRGYMQWTAARLSSVRGDQLATERQVREVEREGGEWLAEHGGVTFLADAAELLDRVGLEAPARAYLERAVARDPEDESCRQGFATVTARSGDPVEGLRAVQELMAGEWFDKGMLWRHVAMQAWASLRIGDHDVGELAARAFELADGSCGVAAAIANERELMTALLPLAEREGSALAREQLAKDRRVIVRLLGEPEIRRGDGTVIRLPAGMPCELVWFLAMRPRGASVERVVDALFPDATLDSGRNRLRQLLHRLRGAADGLVMRDGDRLRLVPAWVDVIAFLEAADRAMSSTGILALRRAHAALAIVAGSGADPGPVGDLPWAQDTTDAVAQRRVAMLDLVAREAAARHWSRELVTALHEVVTHEPTDPDRRARLAAELQRLGRGAEASQLRQLPFLP